MSEFEKTGEIRAPKAGEFFTELTLVERLRLGAEEERTDNHFNAQKLMLEAADEIERLRHALWALDYNPPEPRIRDIFGVQ